MPFGKTMLSRGDQNRPEEEELRFKLRGFLEETEDGEKLKELLVEEEEEEEEEREMALEQWREGKRGKEELTMYQEQGREQNWEGIWEKLLWRTK